MMNESKIIAAYCYYKGKYGSTVIMFRIGNEYQMFLNDARKVFYALNTSVQLVSSNTGGITCVKLPADNILDYLDELSMCGIESKLISYRNDSGNFDFPDVFRLYCEENEDY
jgi:DNA mismatch repair ATPase MutS